MTNIILTISLLLNISVIVLLVYLIKQKTKPTVLEKDEQSLEETRSQIELLQKKFKDDLERTIANNANLVENTSNSISKYYQDTVTTLTLNYNQNTEKLMNLLAEELRKKTADMDKKVVEQLQNSEKKVTDQVKEDLVLVDKEIEVYKQTKLKEIDKLVYQIISETAKNSLGKVINLVDHQQMVMDALETAKKENFF